MKRKSREEGELYEEKVSRRGQDMKRMNQDKSRKG